MSTIDPSDTYEVNPTVFLINLQQKLYAKIQQFKKFFLGSSELWQKAWQHFPVTQSEAWDWRWSLLEKTSLLFSTYDFKINYKLKSFYSTN